MVVLLRSDKRLRTAFVAANRPQSARQAKAERMAASLPRRSRPLARSYTASRERRPKHRAELRVPTVQSEPRLLQEGPGLAGRVARHLLHPCLVEAAGGLRTRPPEQKQVALALRLLAHSRA